MHYNQNAKKIFYLIYNIIDIKNASNITSKAMPASDAFSAIW